MNPDDFAGYKSWAEQSAEYQSYYGFHRPDELVNKSPKPTPFNQVKVGDRVKVIKSPLRTLINKEVKVLKILADGRLCVDTRHCLLPEEDRLLLCLL